MEKIACTKRLLALPVQNWRPLKETPEGAQKRAREGEQRSTHTGRVGDDSANDTSDVTRRESDAELSALGVRILGLREHMRVEQLHNLCR